MKLNIFNNNIYTNMCEDDYCAWCFGESYLQGTVLCFIISYILSVMNIGGCVIIHMYTFKLIFIKILLIDSVVFEVKIIDVNYHFMAIFQKGVN